MALLSFVIVPSRPNADGSHTIRLKITNVNTTRYITTKFRVEKESHFQNGKVVRHPQAAAINQSLRTLLAEYETALSTMGAQRATATEIKNFLERHGKRESGTLREYAEAYIARLNKNGQTSYAMNMGYI